MTLAVRDETLADVAAIRAVNEAAFAGAQEADLVDALRRDGDLLLSLVADDGGVIGHVAFSRMQIEGDPAVALAPVAVLPAQQRRGIGTALIEDGLRRLKQSGETLVFVLGAPAYYGRFGFAAASAARFETPYPGPYFQSLALSPRAPSSGAVRYARAFSALS
ncbi:MAG: GNAT family N-acetyltransferase [Xanthobacteraceae bacterium]|uniref:GNAT family N-acetyltransferase n=1 Tax=Pseudolabrys sp. TaxID=1960880 RepID=UPI003D115C7A